MQQVTYTRRHRRWRVGGGGKRHLTPDSGLAKHQTLEPTKVLEHLEAGWAEASFFYIRLTLYIMRRKLA